MTLWPDRRCGTVEEGLESRAMMTGRKREVVRATASFRRRGRLGALALAASLVVSLATAAGGGARVGGPAPSSVQRADAAAIDATLARLASRLAVEHKDAKLASDLVAVAARRETHVRKRLIRVEVFSRPGDAAEAARVVRRAGGRVRGAAGTSFEALVDVRALAAIAHSRPIRFVGDPILEHPLGVGEEVQATNASAWQLAGLTGSGVKIGVLDLGFRGLAARIGQGEISQPAGTADFCDGKFSEATDHGTAVTEIVHEMAPQASLYLACSSTSSQNFAATKWLMAQGVAIISQSAGTNLEGPGDGTSPLAESGERAVALARAAGILWVNAAGNSAVEHWSGSFTDPNRDRVLDFAPGQPLNTFELGAGASTCADLKWNSWPTTRQDFDLEVLDLSSATPVRVAASENPQTGTQAPIEATCFRNAHLSAATFGVAIVKRSATISPRFDLFVRDVELRYTRADGSITIPADSRDALAVGAACWENWAIEPYSSRGPTLDGRRKPDITAADAVTSVTYGLDNNCQGGFHGTSAAAPNVAGAAALIKQANPSFTLPQLWASVESHAADLGAPGKDNVYGVGRLTLGDAPAGVAALPAVRAPEIGYNAPSALRITSSAATLSANVNPHGAATQVRFEYSPRESTYSSATPWQNVASGSSFVSVSTLLTRLTAGTLYHFRLATKNSAGSANGADQTFATTGGVPAGPTTPPAPTTPAARDTKAPVVHARRASGKRGWPVWLSYSVADNSGHARTTLWVLDRGKRVHASQRSIYSPVGSYKDPWFVPVKAKGPAKFCVKAWDQAGNASAQSCAAIALH